MRVIGWTLGVIVLIVFVLWLGLQVKPRPFGPPTVQAGAVATVPLPGGLPAPLERYLRTVYGDEIPVIESSVFTGRGRIRPFGPWYWPARFRFIHETGSNYRHYIEATWFGIPFFTVNEGYVDGASFFETPLFSSPPDLPKTNQGANLALWAEAAWFPSAWVTDTRARWQAVDDSVAILFLPFEETEEHFVVRFDPATGAQTMMEAMRYRASGDADPKILWLTQGAGEPKADLSLPLTGSATWLDQGVPWAYFTIEDVTWNVSDAAVLLRSRGPGASPPQ